MLQRVLLLLLLTRFLHLIKASAHFNRHNAVTSASAAIAHNSQAPAWQPLSTHNNWIILQTGAAAATNTAPISRHALPYANSHAPTHRLPINYYAYNHSAGNYHQSHRQRQPNPPASPMPAPTTTTSDVNSVEPYVLAISQMRHHHMSSSFIDAAPSIPVRRNEFRPPLVVDSKLPKDNRSINTTTGAATTTKPQPDVGQDIESAENDVSGPDAAEVDVDEQVAGVEQDVVYNEAVDERLNEILLPLESALDKVKQFCEIAKHFISDDDDDATHLNRVAAAATPVDTEASTVEVQGRTVISSPSSRRSSTAAIGTGRKVKKLKKKFKKFLLPLLIAYKLKFLTLIPVLIGGLTLLVGTTGLAGFFFALFTAVMSLKSGGSSKSIIVKKI